jgi:hypothetical protein
MSYLYVKWNRFLCSGPLADVPIIKAHVALED